MNTHTPTLKQVLDKRFETELNYFSQMFEPEFLAYYTMIKDLYECESYVIQHFGEGLVGELEFPLASDGLLGSPYDEKINALFAKFGVRRLKGTGASLEDLAGGRANFILPIDYHVLVNHNTNVSESITEQTWQFCRQHYYDMFTLLNGAYDYEEKFYTEVQKLIEKYGKECLEELNWLFPHWVNTELGKLSKLSKTDLKVREFLAQDILRYYDDKEPWVLTQFFSREDLDNDMMCCFFGKCNFSAGLEAKLNEIARRAGVQRCPILLNTYQFFDNLLQSEFASEPRLGNLLYPISVRDLFPYAQAPKINQYNEQFQHTLKAIRERLGLTED